MSSNTHWVGVVTKHVADRFRIQCEIEHSKHIRVKFSDGSETFLWVVSSTPSDTKRARKQALSDLRKGLRLKYGVESIRSLSEFPVEWAAPFAEERLERELEKEWDEFFEELSRLTVV